jgi:hypothetical protein
MPILKQPWLGMVSTVGIVGISHLIISRFEPALFTTWVSYLWIACVPTMVVIGLLWRPVGFPSWVNRFSRPARGVTFTLLTAVVGLVIAQLGFRFVGMSVPPPQPPLMMYIIFTATLSFWCVIVWKCWPVARFTGHPLVLFLAVLIFSYVGGFVLFRWLFNFTFLQSSVLYVHGMDPEGLFNGWSAISFSVLTVAVMFAWVLLDFWPLTAWEIGQPVRGLVATVVIILVAASIYAAGVRLVRIDPVILLTYGSVPFVFGAMCLLQLFDGQLWTRVAQPGNGIRNIVSSLIVGNGLSALYLVCAHGYVAGLTSGPPTYSQEIWLASALLAITFPLIVILTDFFEFWPIGSKHE